MWILSSCIRQDRNIVEGTKATTNTEESRRNNWINAKKPNKRKMALKNAKGCIICDKQEFLPGTEKTLGSKRKRGVHVLCRQHLIVSWCNASATACCVEQGISDGDLCHRAWLGQEQDTWPEDERKPEYLQRRADNKMSKMESYLKRLGVWLASLSTTEA